jgi:D-alanyl-D-alanine carboxypeptidase
VTSRTPSPRFALALAAVGLSTSALALAACASPAPSATSSTSSGSFDAETVKNLDRILHDAITEHDMPGVTLAIWSPDGEYVSSAGLADVEKKTEMTPALNHRIGSVTKTFVVTALLRLVDDGEVSLDDPISKYVDGIAEGDRITLRNLAGMTSGIPDYTNDTYWQSAYLADPLATLTPQSLIDGIKDEPLHDEPGTVVEYSNSNTILIGLAIEKITGAPLSEVLRVEVTEPLGLDHTFLPEAAEFPEPHAQGYTKQTIDGSKAVATDWNPSWGWAAGAMISDLDDLKVWVPALATGELLSPELQKERLAVTPLSPEDQDSGYGLGLFRLDGWIGHNGGLPGYKTVAIYLPEKEMTLVAFVNSDIDGESDLGPNLLAPVTELLTPENVYQLG